MSQIPKASGCLEDWNISAVRHVPQAALRGAIYLVIRDIAAAPRIAGDNSIGVSRLGPQRLWSTPLKSSHTEAAATGHAHPSPKGGASSVHDVPRTPFAQGCCDRTAYAGAPLRCRRKETADRFSSTRAKPLAIACWRWSGLRSSASSVAGSASRSRVGRLCVIGQDLDLASELTIVHARSSRISRSVSVCAWG
jgi:hypothetical protein